MAKRRPLPSRWISAGGDDGDRHNADEGDRRPHRSSGRTDGQNSRRDPATRSAGGVIQTTKCCTSGLEETRLDGTQVNLGYDFSPNNHWTFSGGASHAFDSGTNFNVGATYKFRRDAKPEDEK
ncbi:uncharacterized protein LOC125046113 isoform X1 [Penaeus chinensis]|uniref:uncharacterized protein LOC125046113 isoform X1 n=1 Tax=Penaeus chinensis TaxID=139456 RepID=UPI001FB61524|nr:uncharacterized protein LOC125046113 isoform X1 [Penaeus chinensis]